MRLIDDKGNRKDEIKTFCLLLYNSELVQSGFVHFNHPRNALAPLAGQVQK